MSFLGGMGVIGWVVSLVTGLVIGGLFFLSIKLQAEYVVRKKQGPLWIIPAALYARLALVAVVLVVVALKVPGRLVPTVMITGLVGAMLGRVLVSRMVRKPDAETQAERVDP